tara:strand:- start:533 stop:862 length:330 start_codon:yes stop_codon:yes gene_type:complete
MTKEKPTTEKPKYDPHELSEIAILGYHAITGLEPDLKTNQRIRAGVEALVKLHDVDPKFVAALGETIAPYLDAKIDQYFGELGLSQSGDSKRADTYSAIGKLFNKGYGE